MDESPKVQTARDSSAAEETANSTATDELQQLKEERDKLKSIAQRAQADLVNYRRRVAEEREQDKKRHKRYFALSMMDIADQLETALNAANLAKADLGWAEGVRAVHKKFITALGSQGFTRYEVARGGEFDPSLHEAVLSTPTATAPEGAILSQIVAGYKDELGDVVRPAQIEIATKPTKEHNQNG